MAADLDEILMLGDDHQEYGHVAIRRAGALVGAMSVGATPDTPSAQFKGDARNEDALSGRDDGVRARLVVADAHFGDQASALLVESIHRVPLDVAAAEVGPISPTTDGSETTLTSVWLDRRRGLLDVQWVGDSLALLLRAGEQTVLVEPDDFFVDTESFSHTMMRRRRFAVKSGTAVVVFSDGVNECHYRCPETSLTVGHIGEIFDDSDSLGSFVDELATQALDGVDGHPGGQDNIAIIAIEI